MVKPSLIFLLTLAIATLISQQANAAEDLSLDEIMHRHVDAMGGLYNWSQVQSIRLAGTIERNGQSADIVIIKKRPNQIRATITLPIRDKEGESFQIIRAHDGKRAWTATRLAGAAELSIQELDAQSGAALLNDSSILPKLISLQQKSCKLTLLNRTKIDGQLAYTIAATSDDKTSYTFYIDPDTFRTVQHSIEAATSKTTVTTLEDYTNKAGIQIPRRSVMKTEGVQQSIIQINSIEIGPGIYDEYFEMAQQ